MSNPSPPFGTSGSEVEKHPLLRSRMDQIFDMLRKRHRRLILLSIKNGLVETEADLMVRGESYIQAGETELVHNHLPKLEDTGYIRWERQRGDISKGPNFDEIEPLFDLFENHADELPEDWP